MVDDPLVFLGLCQRIEKFVYCGREIFKISPQLLANLADAALKVGSAPLGNLLTKLAALLPERSIGVNGFN